MTTTIKHCLPGGEEFIYRVHEGGAVNYVPAQAKKASEEPGDYDSLLFEPPWYKPGSHDRMELRGGRAYVMNDNGATVATYWLADSIDPRIQGVQGEAA